MAQQLADGGVVLRETVPSSDVVRARFGDVDGLRAFAILAIVAYQTVRFIGLPAGVPPAVAQLFSDASQGFTLFLMLSAFSLAYPILAARRSDGATYLDIGRYVTKRLLRIYPAFLAVLAAAFAAHPLAQACRWTAVANAIPAVPVSSVLRSAVFLDGGFGGFADGAANDGFTALALVARGFVLLPVALFLWLRAPRLAVATAVLAAAVDVLTPAHAFTLSAVLPLVLGIVAADMRVQHQRLQRFGLPLALAAALVAFFVEPFLETMAGTVAAPDALRVDPFWSIALFGLVAGVGFSGRLEGVLGFPALRLLGSAAYGISLVAMPVAALATRTLPERFNFGALATSTVAEELGAGAVVWLAVDRFFAGDSLRRRAANGLGAWLDGLLAKVGASRIVFAAPAPPVAEEPEPVELRAAPPPPAFYAPPPRPATDIPVFSTRTGSAEDLAAEILETKARLGERSAAVLDPEPRPAAPDADPYAKPGFYRRPAQPQPAMSSGRLTTAAVATPSAVSRPVAAATMPAATMPSATMPLPARAESPAIAEPPVHSRAGETQSVDVRAIDDAAISTPAAGAPVVEAPVVEAPAVEPPAVEPAAVEPPAVEPPDVEPPLIEAPMFAFATAVVSADLDVRGVDPVFAVPAAMSVDEAAGVPAAVAAPFASGSADASDADALRAFDRLGGSLRDPFGVASSTAAALKATAFEDPWLAPATPRPEETRIVSRVAAGGGDDDSASDERFDAVPASFDEPAPAAISYDEESPLEMLRAAYPPIDEPPAAPPAPPAGAMLDRPHHGVAFRLSAEPLLPREDAPGGESFAELPYVERPRATPSEEFFVTPSAAAWDVDIPALDPADRPDHTLVQAAKALDVAPVLDVPPYDRFALESDPALPSETSSRGAWADLPDLAPSEPDDRVVLESAAAAEFRIVGGSPETMPADERRSPALFRPVVKASLLVRVFKHARAKFKPTADPMPDAPIAPRIPSEPPVPYVRSVAATPTDVAAAPAIRKPAVVPTAPAGIPSTPQAPPPAGRPAIRMRIGPARISHSDGDNG